MKNHPLTKRIRDYRVAVEEMDGCLFVIEKAEFIDAYMALNAMVRNEGFKFFWPIRYYTEYDCVVLRSGVISITGRHKREFYTHEQLVNCAWSNKKVHAFIFAVGSAGRWSDDTGFLVYPTRKRLPE